MAVLLDTVALPGTVAAAQWLTFMNASSLRST